MSMNTKDIELKIPRPNGRAGSIPALGTIFN